MKDRLELDTKFREILGNGNVYFQPPESVKMNYDCIRYKLSRINSIYANNNPYKNTKGYIGIVISKDPECKIIDEILKLPKTVFDRFYVADNLNHWVFIIYL